MAEGGKGTRGHGQAQTAETAHVAQTVWVLLAHDADADEDEGEDADEGFGEQALVLARSLGFEARVLPWTAVPAAAKDIAKSPDALLLLLERGSSLVVRGPAAFRAAFWETAANATRGNRGSKGSKGNGGRGKGGERGIVLGAGLPSLGWAGDACLAAVGRNHLLSWGEEHEPPKKDAGGKRHLCHLDGGCLLGRAEDMANLTRALASRVTAGEAASLPAAAYRYWATWQHEPREAILPRLLLDGGEALVCATLSPDEDLVPVVHEGAEVIYTRIALTRPCVVRAPHGGNLASVLQALRLPLPRSPLEGQASVADSAAKAVQAAAVQLWQTHALEVGVLAALLLAALCWLVAGIVRWTAAAPRPSFTPSMPAPAFYVVHGWPPQ